MAHCRQKKRRRDCQDTFALAGGFAFGDFIICADENVTIARLWRNGTVLRPEDPMIPFSWACQDSVRTAAVEVSRRPMQKN